MPAAKTDRFIVRFSGRAAHQEAAVFAWAREHVIDAVVAPCAAVFYFEWDKPSTDVRRLLARALHVPTASSSEISVTPLTPAQMAGALTDVLVTVPTDESGRIHYILDGVACDDIDPAHFGARFGTAPHGHGRTDRMTVALAFDVCDVEPQAVAGDGDMLTVLYRATLRMHEPAVAPAECGSATWGVRMPQELRPLVTKVYVDGMPHGARARLVFNNHLRAVSNDDGEMSLALPYDTRVKTLTFAQVHVNKAAGDAVLAGTAPYKNITSTTAMMTQMIHKSASTKFIDDTFPAMAPIQFAAADAALIDNCVIRFPRDVAGPLYISYEILFAATRSRASIEYSSNGVEQGTIVTPFVLPLTFWIDADESETAECKTLRLLRATLPPDELKALEARNATRQAAEKAHIAASKAKVDEMAASWEASRVEREARCAEREAEGFPYEYMDIDATFATMYSKPARPGAATGGGAAGGAAGGAGSS